MVFTFSWYRIFSFLLQVPLVIGLTSPGSSCLSNWSSAGPSPGSPLSPRPPLPSDSSPRSPSILCNSSSPSLQSFPGNWSSDPSPPLSSLHSMSFSKRWWSRPDFSSSPSLPEDGMNMGSRSGNSSHNSMGLRDQKDKKPMTRLVTEDPKTIE